LIPGEVTTFDAQYKLTNMATSTLDITVMYWALNATEDGTTYTPEQLEAMGAGNGSALYQALDNAAARGVRIRFLQGDLTSPTYPESLALQFKYPKNVFIQTWIADPWYGGGIMHQKIWIVDNKHFYLGSANMDWLSLTQVKEMGVVAENSPTMAQDLTDYFEAWWKWTSPTLPQEYPDLRMVVVNSSRFQVPLSVPCWSPLLATQTLIPPCRSPFEKLPISKYNIDSPYQMLMQPLSDSVTTNVTSQVWISGSPQEVIAGISSENFEVYQKDGMPFALKSTPGGRTNDEDALVYTILDAQKTVSLSVMDFYPGDLYAGGHGSGPLVWYALTETLLRVATSKSVNVSLLISYWAHTNKAIVPMLKQIQSTFLLCKPSCKGNLNIRLFVVPGWNQTTGTNSTWPPYSRVNHAKYIVTDRRLNIGTSNMEWDYFYQTAGASFNSDDPRLRNTLQQVFDRDWNSIYVQDLNFTPINT